MKNVTLSKSHVVCHPLYKYSILYSCLRIIKNQHMPIISPNKPHTNKHVILRVQTQQQKPEPAPHRRCHTWSSSAATGGVHLLSPQTRISLGLAMPPLRGSVPRQRLCSCSSQTDAEESPELGGADSSSYATTKNGGSVTLRRYLIDTLTHIHTHMVFRLSSPSHSRLNA